MHLYFIISFCPFVFIFVLSSFFVIIRFWRNMFHFLFQLFSDPYFRILIIFNNRWSKEMDDQARILKQMIGQCLLAAARLTYLTSLNPELRERITWTWQYNLVTREFLPQQHNLRQQDQFGWEIILFSKVVFTRGQSYEHLREHFIGWLLKHSLTLQIGCIHEASFSLTILTTGWYMTIETQQPYSKTAEVRDVLIQWWGNKWQANGPSPHSLVWPFIVRACWRFGHTWHLLWTGLPFIVESILLWTVPRLFCVSYTEVHAILFFV